MTTTFGIGKGCICRFSFLFFFFGYAVPCAQFSSTKHVTSTTCYPQWQNNRPALESSGERILEALKKGTTINANPGETPPLAPDVAKNCFKQLANSYEEEYGGFRDAPKFPTPGRLAENAADM